MPVRQEVEAQNLSVPVFITSIQGDKYDPPARVTRLDFKERGHGWVWVQIDHLVADRLHKWYRLGIYETVEVF